MNELGLEMRTALREAPGYELPKKQIVHVGQSSTLRRA